MAVKIQLRRDTAANWTTNDPLLRAGEIGIETDTLKFKIGTGTDRWNAITAYAFKPGLANGVAMLDSSGKIPESQLPDFVTIQELAAAIEEVGDGVFDAYGSAEIALQSANANTTTKLNQLINSAPDTLNTLSELAAAVADGSNALDGLISSISSKQGLLTAGSGIALSNNTISVASNTFDAYGSAATAKSEAITDALADATSKANAAQSAAEAAAALDATSKANYAQSQAVSLATAAAALDATSKANAAQSAAEAAAALDASEKADFALESANLHAEGFIESAIDNLSTSDIPEGTRLYFTDNRAKTAVASDIAAAIANIPGSSLTSTSNLPEGTNLYFTNARAVAATNTARTNVLVSALTAVDDLRTEINTSLNGYITSSERNLIGGVAGLDSSGLISLSAIPSSIARLSSPSFTGDVTVENNLVVDGNLTVNGTTTTVDTANFSTSDALIYLGEGNVANTVDLGIVSSFIDGSGYQHSGIVRDASANKWKFFKGVADEPTTVINFTQGSLDDLAIAGLEASSAIIGSVTNDEIQRLSGVTSGVQSQFNSITSTYATIVSLSTAITDLEAYTDEAINGVNSSLSGYIPESDRNILNGFAGLDSNAKILSSVIPSITNSMLANSSITINGSSISLGSSVNTGYTNGVSSSNVNKITYGTSATPPSSGNSAGDIYIQY
jgi:hypothetical protein